MPQTKYSDGFNMKIKQKLFFAVVSMILLSATAFAVPVADSESTVPRAITNTKTPVADFDIVLFSKKTPLLNFTNKNAESTFCIVPSSTKLPTIKFIDQSTGSPTKWSWNFGDGTTSTAQNPTHTYNLPRKYNVTLTVKKSVYSNTTEKIIIFSGYEKYE